jgi:hypothetical protein
MKFVYITPEFRNTKNAFHKKEHDLIIKYGQPSYSYVNDKEGEFIDTAFEMDSSYYKSPPYEYDNELNKKTFSQICHERACQLRDMDKEIEVFEDDLVMQYLREVCPTDQLFESNINNPRIQTRLVVTPHEYSTLFTFLDRRWKERVRYFFLTQSWNVLSNFQGDSFPIENFQPFYLHPSFEGWANNLYIDRGPMMSNHIIKTYKYEQGCVYGISSEGKIFYSRRKPVKENNLNEC